MKNRKLKLIIFRIVYGLAFIPIVVIMILTYQAGEYGITASLLGPAILTSTQSLLGLFDADSHLDNKK